RPACFPAGPAALRRSRSFLSLVRSRNCRSVGGIVRPIPTKYRRRLRQPSDLEERLHQPEFGRMHPCKDPLNARRLKPELMLQEAGEHRAVIGQHWIVAVLEQRRLLDLDLFAGDAAAIDTAAHHPVDAAVTMIGAAVAILAKRAPELGD